MPYARLPFNTRFHAESVPCPCGDGTIVHHWAEIPGSRRGHPDTWTPPETEDGPTTPCEACGATEAEP